MTSPFLPISTWNLGGFATIGMIAYGIYAGFYNASIEPLGCNAGTQKVAVGALKGADKNLEVMESYNPHPNPMYELLKKSAGTSPNATVKSMLLDPSDASQRCIGNIVTNQGEMDIHFGWKDVNGKPYVFAQMLPRGTDELLQRLGN